MDKCFPKRAEELLLIKDIQKFLLPIKTYLIEHKMKHGGPGWPRWPGLNYRFSLQILSSPKSETWPSRLIVNLDNKQVKVWDHRGWGTVATFIPFSDPDYLKKIKRIVESEGPRPIGGAQ